MFDAKSQTVDKSHAMTFSILFISYDFFSIIIYGHTAFSKQRHFRALEQTRKLPGSDQRPEKRWIFSEYMTF